MLKSTLSIHWKSIRVPLLAAGVTALAIPMFSAQRWFWSSSHEYDASFMLDTMEGLGVLYPLLAAAIGLLVAFTAWSADHRGDHVYARILPLERSQYAMLRYTAGLALLAIPITALGIGAAATAITASVPVGLTAYPLSLTVRFGLAALLAYSVFFAVSAGTARTAGIVLGSLLGVVVLQTFLSALGLGADIIGPAVNAILDFPGPFDVFGGRWMLIDV
jgi:hypothetical protein